MAVNLHCNKRWDDYLIASPAVARSAPAAMSLPSGAKAIGRKQDNLGAPNVLLGSVAVRNQDPKTAADCGRDDDGDSNAHARDSHALATRGIPHRDSNIRFYPLALMCTLTFSGKYSGDRDDEYPNEYQRYSQPA